MVNKKSYRSVFFWSMVLIQMAKLNPGTIHVRMPDALLAQLKQVGFEQRPPVEAAELLRRASVAIIACWEKYGTVPADMEIRQRLVATTWESATHPDRFSLNEGSDHPAATGLAATVTQRLRKAAGEQKKPQHTAHR